MLSHLLNNHGHVHYRHTCRIVWQLWFYFKLAVYLQKLFSILCLKYLKLICKFVFHSQLLYEIPHKTFHKTHLTKQFNNLQVPTNTWSSRLKKHHVQQSSVTNWRLLKIKITINLLYIPHPPCFTYKVSMYWAALLISSTITDLLLRQLCHALDGALNIRP